jgi:hypothetical protein
MIFKPAKSFVHKGKKIIIDGYYNCHDDPNLNPIQRQHLAGDIDIYKPIEAYSERWKTNTKKNGYWEDYDSAHPIEGTRKRNDLPPVYMQWKEDFMRYKLGN